MAERIGAARCPICASEGAAASLMTTKRVCITCNACKCQTFARGDRADELMRRLIAGNLDRQPAAPVAAPAPGPDPQPQTEPAPAAARSGWGLFG